ncbi:MAG TPA: hypothetical protein VMV72_12520 [Verrucomicrobiae bacterium]|nr:hypothetical protein [Verrucomicrobiae bacterium]
MTPQDEAALAETVLRLQADSTFQAIRVSVLEWVLESLVRKSPDVSAAKIPDDASIHQFVMQETLARVREKMRIYADSDPDMASAIAKIVQDYEQES